MSPREETIDENIVPLRLSRKRSRRKTRERFRFDPRRHLGRVGYVALALGSFLLFFVSSLPLERLSGQILQIASAQTGMIWNAESVEIGIFLGPRVSFEKLTISPRPGAPASDLFSRIVGDGLLIDHLTFRPSLWKLLPILGIKPSLPGGSFSAEIYGADLDGSFVAARDLLELDLEISDLDLKRVPQINAIVNVEGTVKEAALTLFAPRARIGGASGSLNIQADKLSFDPSVLSQAEMIKSLGSLNLGKLDLRTKLKNGTLSLNEASVSGPGSDLEVKLEGDLKLQDDIAQSDMRLVLWLTPSQKLQALFPLVANLLQMEKKTNSAYVTRITGNFLSPTYSKY